MTIDEGIESLVRSAESQAATLRSLLEMIKLLDERITALEDNNEPTASEQAEERMAAAEWRGER